MASTAQVQVIALLARDLQDGSVMFTSHSNQGSFSISNHCPLVLWFDGIDAELVVTD